MSTSFHTFGVGFVDHVDQLKVGWTLSQRPQDGAEVLGRDETLPGLVEHREGHLELGDLIRSTLLK